MSTGTPDKKSIAPSEIISENVSPNVMSPLNHDETIFCCVASLKNPTPEDDGVSEESIRCEMLINPGDHVHLLSEERDINIYVNQEGNFDNISPEEAEKLVKKCFNLNIKRDDFTKYEEGERVLLVNGMGHAGLVHYKNAENVDKFRLVTCKHCLQSKTVNIKIEGNENDEGRDVTFLCKGFTVELEAVAPNNQVYVKFPEANYDLEGNVSVHNLRNKRTWKFGYDMAWSNELLRKEGQPTGMFFQKDHGFELVRTGFLMEVGLKIGIIFYNKYGVVAKNAVTQEEYANLSNDTDKLRQKNKDLKKNFGPKESFVIYRGEIEHVDVRQSYIEHSMNTYKGCSGAIIFILDTDQPIGIQKADRGKAIAVHAGYHPGLKKNIGFRLILP